VKNIRPYHFLLTALLALCTACGNRKSENVTLWRNDKNPYGSWYAYNELQYIFPGAKVQNHKLSPDRYGKYDKAKEMEYEKAASDDHKKTAYMIFSNQVKPDNKEVAALLNLVREGKHVFISSLSIGQNLLDSLQLKTGYSSGYYNLKDSLTVLVANPLTRDALTFSYPGRSMANHIVQMDSSITTILGEDEFGRANFVKFDYEGGGSLYVHFAPMAFSNFFLLHKQNKGYYDNALSWLPRDLELIRWDEYFRYYEEGDQRGGDGGGSFSALGWIGRQRGLSAALWLTLLLFALIYLFESKRKQRIIPVISSLKNASLDFVKTIGSLYYQRRDNKNLAQKMVAHFMDHVRAKYNIRISAMDEEFEKRLAWKTGHDAAAISALMNQIHFVQLQTSVSDDALMDLNAKLENFYKANT
jgi:hypothetical protein